MPEISFSNASRPGIAVSDSSRLEIGQTLEVPGARVRAVLKSVRPVWDAPTGALADKEAEAEKHRRMSEARRLEEDEKRRVWILEAWAGPELERGEKECLITLGFPEIDIRKSVRALTLACGEDPIIGRMLASYQSRSFVFRGTKEVLERLKETLRRIEIARGESRRFDPHDIHGNVIYLDAMDMEAVALLCREALETIKTFLENGESLEQRNEPDDPADTADRFFLPELKRAYAQMGSFVEWLETGAERFG